MFRKKEKEGNATAIKWQILDSVEQLPDIIEESRKNPVMIYKHSTRCGISGMALNRIERNWGSEFSDFKPYYLDLIAHREVSNAIASRFGVYHESPQVIIIKNGKAVYDASHMQIDTDRLISYK